MTQMCDELHSNSFLRKEIDIFYLTGFLAKSLALTPDKSVRRSNDIVSSGGFVGRVCRFSRRRKKRERERERERGCLKKQGLSTTKAA